MGREQSVKDFFFFGVEMIWIWKFNFVVVRFLRNLAKDKGIEAFYLVVSSGLEGLEWFSFEESILLF